MYGMQHLIYELLADFGPIWSAAASGLAIYINGELQLTWAGEAYLKGRRP